MNQTHANKAAALLELLPKHTGLNDASLKEHRNGDLEFTTYAHFDGEAALCRFLYRPDNVVLDEDYDGEPLNVEGRVEMTYERKLATRFPSPHRQPMRTLYRSVVHVTERRDGKRVTLKKAVSETRREMEQEWRQAKERIRTDRETSAGR